MKLYDLWPDADDKILDLAAGARDLVKSVAPHAFMEAYPGWGGYLIFKPAEGTGITTCHVSAHARHVSIGLPQGTGLPDPAKLLQGKGKQSRHLKITSAADLARPEVRALIAAAWAQQPDVSVIQGAVERVRELCLALPETRETVSHGHPTWWAGKKQFAVFGLYSPSVAFKAGLDLHSALAGDPRVIPTPYMAKAGWLSLRVDENTDWDEVRRLLLHSYRQVATARLRASLEAGS